MKTLAGRVVGKGRPISIDDVEIPKPGDNDVLVKVKASGVCGSDVHFRRGDFDLKMPVTLGHEGAGVIEEVGKNVVYFKPGDKVAIHYCLSCGHCKFCLEGNDNRCGKGVIGVAVDGSWAEYVKIPAANAIKYSGSVDFAEVAIATCAVVTPYHALGLSRMAKGDNVVVFGAGGTGLHGVMWARFFGARRVISVDVVDSKLETAKKYGADVTINPLKVNVLESISRETEGWGADVVLECSGSQQALEQAIKAIKLRGNAYNSGTVVSVGVQLKPLPKIEWADFRDGLLTVSGDHTRLELAQVIRLLESGRIDLSESVTHRIKLSEVNRGLDMLEAKKEHVERIVVEF